VKVLAVVKPKLRGWLHLIMVPAAVICGIVLVALSPPQLRVATTIYALSTVLLFSISATFHRGNWGPKMHGTLQRMDHATIFLLIAGSYTPFAVAVITGEQGKTLLWIIWSAALLGMIFRVVWVGAPRWLIVPIYIALGWCAMFYLPTIWRNGGTAVFFLLLAGGICYSVGGVIYGLRRPNPSPKWFGFHEVFHSLTLGGYVTHYVGVSLAVYGFTVAASSS